MLPGWLLGCKDVQKQCLPKAFARDEHLGTFAFFQGSTLFAGPCQKQSPQTPCSQVKFGVSLPAKEVPVPLQMCLGAKQDGVF